MAETIVNVLIMLGVGLVVCIGAAIAHTVWMLTHPPRAGYVFAVARGLPGEPGEMRVDGVTPEWEAWDATLCGQRAGVWDIKGCVDGGPTIIVTHGWGESRVVMLGLAQRLGKVSGRVVLWDLPGHGERDGTCGLGTREVDELCELAGVVGGKVVLYGRSLGAGVSLAAAAQLEEGGAGVRGVIAEAVYRVPITPARNVLRLRGLPWRVTLPVAMGVVGLWKGGTVGWARAAWSGAFDRAVWAKRVRCPVLVLHGDADVISPIEDGLAVAEAARGARTCVIKGGGHNDLWANEALATQCEQAVGSFLSSLSRAFSLIL